MKRLHLVSLLHAYQPWWQFGETLDRIVDECYRPVFSFLKQDRRYRLALNVQWSLIEQLHNRGHQDVIADLISLAVTPKRIEVVGTAAYHPIMPFIDPSHAQAQIDYQKQMLWQRLMWQPKGFFPPEMGVTPATLEMIKTSGYQWVITDERSWRSANHWTPVNPSTTVFAHNGLPVFLRDNRISESIAFKPNYNGRWLLFDAVARFLELQTDEAFFVFANDIETYGHHKPYFWDQVYMQMVDRIAEGPIDGVEVILSTPSDVLNIFPQQAVQIPDSSWSWTDGNPFPLWCDSGHHARAHQILWDMYRLSWKAVSTLPAHHHARRLVDHGAASCSWWWFAYGHPHYSLFSTQAFINAARSTNDQCVAELVGLETELKQRYSLN